MIAGETRQALPNTGPVYSAILYGGEWNSTISITDLSGVRQSVALTIFLEGQGAFNGVLDLPGNGTIRLPLPNPPNVAQTGYVRIVPGCSGCVAATVKLKNRHPSRNALEAMAELQAGSQTFKFPVGNGEGRTTKLMLLNPSEFPTTVLVTEVNDDGTVIGSEWVTLQPRQLVLHDALVTGQVVVSSPDAVVVQALSISPEGSMSAVPVFW